MQAAEISEIFFSIQGEGLFIGYPQIFVRFAGCNLSCRYCDLLRNERPVRSAFRNATLSESLTLTASGLIAHILPILKKKGSVHSVSLTGGEPLVQADFLAEFLPLAKRERIPVYFETNGTLPENLKTIGSYLDFIAMDLKIPSATGQAPMWREHRNFLKVCRGFPAKTFVKVVVAKGTTPKEVIYAAELVRKIAPNTPMIVQPVLNRKGLPEVSGQKLLLLFQTALDVLPTARLIPPVHQLLRLP